MQTPYSRSGDPSFVRYKIAVDCRPLMEKQWSGVAVYTYNMIKALSQREDLELDLFYFGRKRQSHLDQIFPNIRFYPIPSWQSHLRALLGKNATPPKFWKQRPDLMWIPDRRPPEHLEGVPIVFTIHDDVPESNVNSQSWKARLFHFMFPLKKILKKATGVILPSLAVHSHVQKWMPKSIKTEVIYEGGDHANGLWEELPSEKLQLKNPYFLLIGSADPRKRMDWVLRAAKRFPRMDFICVGAVNRDARFSKLHADISLKNITMLASVSESEKTRLLKKAKALIAISSNEGFDLPVLEAVTHKCPVILSDIPVHRELYESTRWVEREEDLWRELERMWRTPPEALRKEIPTVKGIFTWEKAAKRALFFFIRVLSDKNRQGGGNRDSQNHSNNT